MGLFWESSFKKIRNNLTDMSREVQKNCRIFLGCSAMHLFEATVLSTFPRPQCYPRFQEHSVMHIFETVVLFTLTWR